jgi:hypothetical protein
MGIVRSCTPGRSSGAPGTTLPDRAMTGSDVESTLRFMHSLLCRPDLDATQRDAADLEFRRLYRLLTEECAALPFAVAEELREALLALVGDDDWTAACVHMQEALRLWSVASG